MLEEEFILRGPSIKCSTPSQNFSIGKDFIEGIKKRNSDDVFCIDGDTGRKLLCREVLDQTFKIVMILKQSGVEYGDVVGIISENCINYCSAVLASIYIGAAVNPLNPMYSADELKHSLNITKPKLIFCSNSAVNKLDVLITKGFQINKLILLQGILDGKNALTNKICMLDTLFKTTRFNTEETSPAILHSKDHIAFILLSSGTTGLPKCAMLTHETFGQSNTNFNKIIPEQVHKKGPLIAVMPFFHIFGLSAITTAASISLKLIIVPSFRAESFLCNIQTFKVTQLYAVPSMISFLTDSPLIDKYDLSTVEYILCTGGYLPPETQRKFLKMHPRIKTVQLYGATECNGAVTALLEYNPSKPGSVGYVLPNIELMIWDKDLCKNVGQLAKGEICIRGPVVMKGYLEENNNDIDENKFYHSGDLGYYDEDGHLFIVGRMKELIKYKGYQVAPAELENLLMKHEAVVECAVIGIPDDRAGQLPTAFIVRKPNVTITETDIVEFVAERISVQKHLHGGVKFISNIPRNAAGKILRNVLLELYKSM